MTGTRVPAPGARTAPRSAESKRAHTATSGSKSPARADQLQDHAARLLRQGDELTDWLLAAQAPGQAAQAESRVRDALPVVLEAINLSVTGLDQLSGGRAVHAFEHARWLDALTTVRNLPWESLPGNQGREKDINAARALGDVRSRLDQLAEPVDAAPVVVEQARAQLILLRAQVKAAQAGTGGTPSATWLTEVLAAMVRIVRTIAAGLLAAASAAATQGGDIASQVIAAAVGLAVSAVSAEAGQAARSRWYSPTVATRLDGVHHDLISTVDDLSRYLPRLAPGSSPSKGDTLLVRETQFAALACAYHAKGLAMALDWPAAADYSGRLNRVGDLLSQVSNVTETGNQSPALAASLAAMVRELASFSIPPDAHIHELAPESLLGRKDHPRREGSAAHARGTDGDGPVGL